MRYGMTKHVYKYEINSGKAIHLPHGAKINSVNFQGKKVFLWALVNPRKELDIRTFDVFSTGEAIHRNEGYKLKFVGSAFKGDGDVVHIYERKNHAQP
jgi:hypothetical protein